MSYRFKAILTVATFSVLVAAAQSAEYVPPSALAPTITAMKNRGCVFSGLLGSEPYFSANDFDRTIAMLKRSDCAYLHRSVETWVSPPDFSKIAERVQKIKQVTGKDYIYEMMIAEAIKVDSIYFYPAENRNFSFDKMCRAGTANFWGTNTCVPSFYQEEYRKYVRYISEQAINAGITSIMFGEIGHQDNLWWQEPTPPEYSAPAIVKPIRDYAASRGKNVVIVAQAGGSGLIPGESRSSAYAKHFDFILGSLGIGEGRFDECLDSDSTQCKVVGSTQWRIYSPAFRKMAHNVLVMMDWASSIEDDPKVLARMTPDERAVTLLNAYTKLKERSIGFIMTFIAPMGGPLSGTECYGPNSWTYSADKTYTHARACKDEDAIHAAFEGVRWTVDTQPPKISNVHIAPLSTSSVTISWVTNEPATSRITFGRRGEASQNVIQDTALRTDHVFGIAVPLEVSIEFSIGGSDAAGNPTAPETRVFTRTRDPGTPSPAPLPNDPPPSPSPSPLPSPAPSPSSPGEPGGGSSDTKDRVLGFFLVVIVAAIFIGVLAR